MVPRNLSRDLARARNVWRQLLNEQRSSQQTLPNGGLTLGHCLRRWPNINPALGESMEFVCRRPHALVVVIRLELRRSLR